MAERHVRVSIVGPEKVVRSTEVQWGEVIIPESQSESFVRIEQCEKDSFEALEGSERQSEEKSENSTCKRTCSGASGDTFSVSKDFSSRTRAG